MFKVPASKMGTHTAIIAQSGSGKSFFLGRIVEELMLRTKARCLILDPNADFRKVHEVEGDDLWDKAVYDRDARRGKLPHERSRAEFYSLWSKIPIRVRADIHATGGECEQLKIQWPSLSMAFLAEDVNPMIRSDLYHCHAFVKSLGEVLDYKLSAEPKAPIDLIDEAERVFHLARSDQMSKSDLRATLEREFNAAEMLGKEDRTGPRIRLSPALVEGAIRHFIESALTVSKYVSKDVERFYFGKAREFQAAGILQTASAEDPWAPPPYNRLEVVDLPSLSDRNTRLLVISAILATEWKQARESWGVALEKPPSEDERVPTFIVVDEAHNLIPRTPRSRLETALREQFRTVVAEGRKYGLFLVVVSQRPDKLDPLILSECENRAVMRLRSVSVLDLTKRMLGLDELSQKLLEKCLEFETGRALLTGLWAPEATQIYGAARRTVEGGRNLRVEHWGRPV
jgi:DNA helicase HerA-like ATPase